MYKPLSAFIGLRYLGAKKQNHFISFISLTSMLGIALGVTTLITVISVMNGFEKELRARILGAISHATIQPLEGPLDEWREVIDLDLAGRKGRGLVHAAGSPGALEDNGFPILSALRPRCERGLGQEHAC